MWKEDATMQKAIGYYLPKIFPNLSKPKFIPLFETIKYMIDIKDEVVSNAWYDVLFEYVQYVPLDFLKKDVIAFITSKGGLSETDRNRIFCSKIFVKLMDRLNGVDIESLFLDQAVQMCQDTSHRVRMHMAQNIEIIAHKIGLKKTKEYLAEELFQLLEDETKDVKQCAFTTLVHLLDFFDIEFRQSQIVPRLVDCVSNPPYDLYKTIIQHFGEMFWKISEDIQNNEEAISVFKGFFVETCKDKSSTVRQQCAYNFIAVLKSLGAKRYAVSLHNSLKALCSDTDVIVRQRIASSFHLIAQILNTQQSAIMLKEMFMKLIKDKDQGVKDRIVSNLSDIFTCFHQSSLSSEQLFSSFVQPIIEYEPTVRKNWRQMIILMETLDKISIYFRADDIYTQFIPLVKRQLFEGSSAPLRSTAAKSLVILSRRLQNNSQQVQLFKNLTNELARGKSYWYRMVYLDLSLHTMEFYSRSFFKQQLLESTMQLSQDLVANVRMKFCTLLPQLKRVLSPSTDVKFIAKLKERSSFLTLDKDLDVMEAAKLAHEQITTLELEIARGNAYSLQTKEDTQDDLKYKQELEWVEQEKELEKNRRRIESNNSTTIPKNRTPTKTKPSSTKPLAGSTSTGSTGVKKKKVVSTSSNVSLGINPKVSTSTKTIGTTSAIRPKVGIKK